MLMIIATQVFFGSRIFAYLRNCDVNMKNMKIFSLEIEQNSPFPLTMKIRVEHPFYNYLQEEFNLEKFMMSQISAN